MHHISYSFTSLEQLYSHALGWIKGWGSLHSERVDTLVLFCVHGQASRLDLETLQILEDRHLDLNSLPQAGSDLLAVQLPPLLRLAVDSDCHLGRLHMRQLHRCFRIRIIA